MKDWESKLESTKLQKESAKIKWDSKLELEKLRHSNIMKELEYMAKYKIKNFVRGNNDIIKDGDKK